ncbi:hypothetical protein AH845_003963 [Salmonella enterica subsp. enterica]|nr:hypothetical protein [Salmonella enterica subsp. enterica]
MTKPASTTKNPRKQHTPEFSHEALKRAERIGVAAAARNCWYVWHQRRHQINRRQQFCLPVITSSGRHSILALSNVRQSAEIMLLHTAWLRPPTFLTKYVRNIIVSKLSKNRKEVRSKQYH